MCFSQFSYQNKISVNISRLNCEARAQSFWALANSYLAAAVTLQEKDCAETRLPSIFLLLHALELHLKSFLISRGLCERELKRVGHDLLVCMRLCKEHGLSSYVILSWRQQIQIMRLNQYYKYKELEYFVPHSKKFGNIEQLNKTVEQIAKALFTANSELSFGALSRP